MRRQRRRPSPDQLFAAVVELVASGAGAFKGTARRYSLCAADAEDAYQHSLEILMTKAPTAERTELRPWLHTVIKHEALAIRRQRERMLVGGETTPEREAEIGPSPEESAGERERACRSAEALSQLKASELQCLLLKALGYSYDEIAARTGFSWTKVNRSLTEGRRRFFDGYSQIESGKRCERFRPLLSAASDGEASAEDESKLRTHLRSCQSCRAALRGYRTVPVRLGELVPPVLLPVAQKESWWSRLYEALVAGVGDRAGAIGHKLQQTGELVTAQKTTAVVASTAALAGGVAVKEQALPGHERQAREHGAEAANRAPASGQEAPPVAERPPAPPAPPAPVDGVGPAGSVGEATDAPPGGEFSPEAGVPPQRAEPAAAGFEAGSADAGGGATASGRGASERAGDGGEFGP